MSALAPPCPACGRPVADEPFYRCAGVPTNSVILCPTRARALSLARGDIALVCCPACGLIFNRDYDPVLCQYNERYEESQAHSAVFNAFHRELAASLVERYGLRNRTILEIGCGKGDFLHLLCRLGGNRGIGYDPAYVPARTCAPAAAQVTIHPSRFPKTYDGPTPDCIICKMTLEHIRDVHAFLLDIRQAIRPGQAAIVVFQVPDSEPILAENRFWDIYYEHCSYFTRPSFSLLFQRCGFRVLNIAGAYHRQYLVIEARPADCPPPNPEENSATGQISTLTAAFAGEVARDSQAWRDLLRERYRHGARVVLWGGGSKAVAFLTTLRLHDEVRLVVDINPHKQNAFLPGTGHLVAAPDELSRIGADLVLVMNPMYLEEIGGLLRQMGLTPVVLPLTGETLRLLAGEEP
jgi:SAM-dependent methyltransferase